MQLFFASHFPALLKASAQAAVLIVLVLAVQRAFARQLKPRWRYALWLLVVVRLALPWTMSSALSVFNYLNLSHAPASWKLHYRQLSASPLADAGAQQPGSDATPAPESNAAAPLNPATRELLCIWAIGVCAFAVSLLVAHFRLSRRISLRRPLVDAPVLNLLEDCKQQMGVRTPVTLVETAEVGSPTLFGFIRPRLLLPAGLTRNFSSEELRYIFLHELAHIKRNDILAGWFMTALQILHWFNPFVWLAGYRMRADRELACDALALSYARDDENQPYGQTIIKLLENFGRSAWAPSMAGAVESKNQLKERIRMIAGFKKTNQGLTLAVALLAGLGLITLTDAQSPGDVPLDKEILGKWVLVGRPDGHGSPGAAPADGARYKTFTNGTFLVHELYPDFYPGATLDDHGGPYTLEGDKLTEDVQFTKGLEVVSKQAFDFKVKIEGDTYTQIGISNDFNEVWKRVKSEAPKPKTNSTTALQGTWLDPSGISLVIHDSTVEFHEADTNNWLKAVFTLYDTEPKQIAAVVTGTPDSKGVGTPIFGIYEIKDGTLTVSGYDPGFPAVPTSFDAAGARKIVFTRK